MTDAPPCLYHSHLGLFPFQEDGIARAYLETQGGGGRMVVWDTGTGKSHFALRMATLLFEDDEIDVCLIVAEQNKIGKDEWLGDFEKFTDLTAIKHHGPGRFQRLEKAGMPQVLITTYETGKADTCKFVKVPGKRGTSMSDGPLMEHLKDKRVLVILDECTKVANHTSANYKAWKRTLDHLRKANKRMRVFGMTATPIERDWENGFDQLRQIAPMNMILVKEFNDYFVRDRDPFDRPRYREERMHEFAALAHPLILRKRKTDPDVKDFFPRQVEESRHFEMADDQRELYEAVELLVEEGEEPLPGHWSILRQIAGHPPAVLHSAIHGQSKLAKILVEEWGADRFKNCSSVKAKELLNYVVPLVKGQGEKVMVFTFFGPSMIPSLAKLLREKKIKVYTMYGAGRTQEQNEEQKIAFRTDPNPAVLLLSDIGARGINVPEATYVVEYESATTYAKRTQRINRVHRIDSEAVSVTCMTFFVDDTVEQAIGTAMIERNTQQDQFVGDDIDEHGDDSTFMSAEQRREALSIARNKRRAKRRKKAA